MNTQSRILSVFVVLVGLFFVGPLYGYEEEINALSLKLATDISVTGKLKVAVVDFTDTQGNITELGRFLAEEFSAALLEAGKGLEVIDRTQIRIILRENKLAETGLIDQATTMKLGQIAGVEALVSGTITPFGDTVRLTVRALDVNTARVLASARGNIAKTQAIQELLTAGVNAPEGVGKGRDLRKSGNARSTRDNIDKTVNDLLFELDHCEQRGDGVECIFFVTNNKGDREISDSSGGARIITDSGLEHSAQGGLSLGGRKPGFFESRSTLATGIRTRGSVYFTDVASTVERISILELSFLDFSNSSKGLTKVQFRDIPLIAP